MYIKRVAIENIKGFSCLDFDFNRGYVDNINKSYAGWTVFTGDNGSGKSTLLKAITLALTGKETARSLQPSFRHWLRHGEAEGSIQLEIVPIPADDTFSDSGNTSVKPFPAQIIVSDGGGKEPVLQTPQPKGNKKSIPPDRSIWSPNAQGWFSCAYGPFRRIQGASAEASRIMVAPNTERFVTLFLEEASLAEVDRWMRDLKYKELEGNEEAKQQLDILIEILQDDLMPNQISIARVDSEGLWLQDRNGVVFSILEMSDGYRAALALLADIIRHLIKTYGTDQLTGRDDEGKIFIKRSGVVLIDEIDAHLHPEWQRVIGFWLTKHFRNIQFLVTTHSPLICQAADKQGLFRLPEPGSDQQPWRLDDEDRKKIVASRPDTILLSPAFGLQNTRSPQAVEARRESSELKAKKRSGATLTKEEDEKLKQLDLFIDSDIDSNEEA